MSIPDTISVSVWRGAETGRFHPCYLTWAPFPGGPDAQKDAPKRWRSKAHHTSGVQSEEEAKKEMEKLVKGLRERMGEPRVDFGTVEWDGTTSFTLLSGADDERS